MLCEDSNGQSEIIAVCLLVFEDAPSITWMMNTFKKMNSKWENIKIVQTLPDVSVLICLFHTLRSFRREIGCEKMGITSGQRTLCLELVQKMAYAYSDEVYNQLYSQFMKDAPREVAAYFNLNRHTIRKEWVLGLKFTSGSFLNTTNNRLESVNGKLKQVITKRSSLEDFINHFFIILGALRTERDHKAAIMFQKVKVYPFAADSPEMEYSKLLTSYASQFVLQQMKLVEKVKPICGDDNEIFMVQTSEGPKTMTISDCECTFYRSMSLPCRHIFALRAKLEVPLFDPDMCNERWTSAYYRATQRLFSASSAQPILATTVSKEHRRKLSQHEKFRKASLLSSELASVASEASTVHFSRRLKVIRDIIMHWKNGEEVAIVDVQDGRFHKMCGAP